MRYELSSTMTSTRPRRLFSICHTPDSQVIALVPGWRGAFTLGTLLRYQQTLESSEKSREMITGAGGVDL